MNRWTRIALNVLIGAVILIAASIATVRILVQPADTAFVDFAELRRSPTPNDALACPPGFCFAKADLTVAPAGISAETLAAKVRRLPSLAPRTVLVGADDAGRRYVLVQRSALFDIPDTINIVVEPIDANHATLAIYSRSRYGKTDLGGNMKRVQHWLSLLGIAVVG